MLRSSRRESRTKAIAQVLALIANTRPQHTPHWPYLDDEESIYEDATEFCAALEQYAARTAYARIAIEKSDHYLR
jgi:hypothetical protein